MQEHSAKLIYASNMSLDRCTEGAHGGVVRAPPDDDVFVFITEVMRSAGTYLYGRRMYERLAVWETDADRANQSDSPLESRLWSCRDHFGASSAWSWRPDGN
jgi:hypothetical protein